MDRTSLNRPAPSRANKASKPGAVTMMLALYFHAADQSPWKKATKARVLPQAGQAPTWKSFRHKQRLGKAFQVSRGIKHKAASAKSPTATRTASMDKFRMVYFCRSGFPSASGSLFIAIRMKSINHQIPHPPRVTSLRIPSPT